VVEAYEAGVVVAHLHFRDIQDRPTADPHIAQRTIDMIADRCPVLVQVSTGVGFNVPCEDRAALVELWPRMATLNPCTMTFGSSVFDNPPAGVRRLASRMRDLGIKPELEIYDSGHLDECLRLRDEGYLDSDRMQFSIVVGVRGGMAATPQNLFAIGSTAGRRGVAGCRDRAGESSPVRPGPGTGRQRTSRARGTGYTFGAANWARGAARWSTE
jgi:3-keto-5-aminohexanoate cleavage enzyme